MSFIENKDKESSEFEFLSRQERALLYFVIILSLVLSVSVVAFPKTINPKPITIEGLVIRYRDYGYQNPQKFFLESAQHVNGDGDVELDIEINKSRSDTKHDSRVIRPANNMYWSTDISWQYRDDKNGKDKLLYTHSEPIPVNITYAVLDSLAQINNKHLDPSIRSQTVTITLSDETTQIYPHFEYGKQLCVTTVNIWYLVQNPDHTEEQGMQREIVCSSKPSTDQPNTIETFTTSFVTSSCSIATTKFCLTYYEITNLTVTTRPGNLNH